MAVEMIVLIAIIALVMLSFALLISQSMKRFRPKIDRRPRVYCVNCRKFVGVDEHSLVCTYCTKRLSSKKINVLQLCQDNRRAHNAVYRVWAWAGTFWIFFCAIGWAFKEYQHNHMVDAVYFGILAVIPLCTWWYVNKRIKPEHKSVYENPLFTPGYPEDVPPTRMGFSEH